MPSPYSIDINTTNKKAKQLFMIIIGIAFISFWILYFFEPLIILMTRDLNSKLIWYPVFFFIVTGTLSLLLLGIKNNKSGLLSIHSDYVEIISKLNQTNISFKDLKRISFIVPPLFFKPYLIEFIYPDSKFIRVRLKTKEEFYEVMDHLYEVTPKQLEKYLSTIESDE